jgi:short-subunit dehydrogenase
MQTFDRKVVLIAGGASGIGREIAYQLQKEDAIVVVANRHGQSLDTFRTEQADSTTAIEVQEADMTVAEDVRRLVEVVVAAHGRIDYFFNCVGIVQGGEVKDTPLDVAQHVIRTNIDAITIGSHYVYRHMVRQGSGHLINFASAAGLLPTPLMPFYTTSKSAIVGFSHALRAEAAAFGIKVSVACPGFVKTPIYEKSYYNNIQKEKSIDILFHRIPIQSPTQAATRILRGVRRNRATIHTWYSLHLAWLFYRLLPNAYIWLAGKMAQILRRRLEINRSDS